MIFEDIVEIPFSKRKLSLYLLLSTGIFALGIWLFAFAEDFGLSLFYVIPLNNTFLGITLIALGIWSFFVFMKRRLSNTPALILDKDGFINNTLKFSIKEVSWNDVEGFKKVNVYNNSFLVIYLKDPEQYIMMQTGGAKRKSLQLNNKLYGSPLMIPSSNIDCSFDQLQQTMTAFWKKRETDQTNPLA